MYKEKDLVFRIYIKIQHLLAIQIINSSFYYNKIFKKHFVHHQIVLQNLYEQLYALNSFHHLDSLFQYNTYFSFQYSSIVINLQGNIHFPQSFYYLFIHDFINKLLTLIISPTLRWCHLVSTN